MRLDVVAALFLGYAAYPKFPEKKTRRGASVPASSCP